MHKDFVHQAHFMTATLSHIKAQKLSQFLNSSLQDYQNEVASFLNIHFCTQIFK